MVVFTDLDGTLLDHDDYGFAPAREALAALRSRAIPLVLTTSKTLAEVLPINRRLDNTEAVIVENGGAVAVAADRLAGRPPPLGPDCPMQLQDDLAVQLRGPAYEQLRNFIDRQRQQHGYHLRGFGDMPLAEIIELTGLPADDSRLAAQRLCSEPFVWDDSAARLDAFRAAAAQAGLSTTRGGRFWHLMGNTSKAAAMRDLAAWIGEHGHPTTLALGDGDNDRGMLQQADIAVCVRRKDGSILDCRGRRRTLRTQQPGPAGWNRAVLEILAGSSPSNT
jgi:mannosyl-3-phosphoglycerate phosphatase